MAFYTFNQNNSGGVFIINDFISKYVIIEASSVSEANNKAKEIGIYFNGCEEGTDCSCCGDRWYEIYGEDEGTDIPMIDGESILNISNSDIIIYYNNGDEVFIKATKLKGNHNG